MSVAGLRRTAEAFTVARSPYRNNRVGWVHDCIQWPVGKSPTEYQAEILGALDTHARVAVRGPHGIGKTALDAWAVLHFATTRDVERIDWKLPTVASAWRQLTHYLWPEIRKWERLLNWDKIGRKPFTQRELLKLNLKLTTGEAFAVATSDAASIEGAHADSLFYLLDEAKAIPPDTWDAIEGAFSGAGTDTEQEAIALANSTPGEPLGRFWEIQSRKPGYEDWFPIHVTLDQAIAAGRISAEWAEQKARQWGVKSATYKNRVLGEFAESGRDSVIPLAWVERAVERWHEYFTEGSRPDGTLLPLPNPTNVGVDVARGGDDRTVIAPRHGWVWREFIVVDLRSTTSVANLVEPFVTLRGVWATIDVLGPGGGVYDQLEDRGREVQPYIGSAATNRRDRTDLYGFTNVRSAAYWNLRELLDPESGEDVALPDDDELLADLVAPKWKEVTGAKIQVEPKESVQARLGRSPDKGDALVMSAWPERPPVVGLARAQIPPSGNAGPAGTLVGNVWRERW